ncbi:solute carrier family 2, facilitated glucose transporter member 6 isoform X2 [Camelus dromedarius]|uniref:solute carrier family 2, facilitated glucose transporter member 6 isoform X2 n=1 Tax=Camelus dromedarius TaxID=9838 RepID=UPI00311A573C
MQEPLLGTEGPDYDTFPERTPPSPRERTGVGALQNKKLFLATFAAVLGNFSFGYALVYTSPVIPALEHSLDPNLSLTKTQASWFGSVFTLGAAAGGLSAMVLNDLLGRKLSIMFSAVPSAAGYALMAGAHGLWMLLLGRMLTGFAGGLTAACIPACCCRGAGWRWPGRCPCSSWSCCSASCPTHLASCSRGAGTRRRYRRWPGFEELTSTSAGSLGRSRTTFGDSRISWAEARDPHMYRPIVIALLMRFLQQLTGITPILVYLQSIFDSTAVLLPPKDDAAIVGAVRLLSVLIAALTMDLAGRKVLLFISAASMFAANLTLGLYVHFGPKPLTPNSTVGLDSAPLWGTEQPPAAPAGLLTLVPLLATMLFIMGYAMGWGPITWLLMSEILPLRARGVASGLCVLVSWLTAFALTKSFLLVVNAFGLQVPFFFFAAICLVNLAFTGCCVPETKGRSLEQIESFFRTGRRSFLR